MVEVFTEEDLPDKYVYFPLHFQPEATTMPLGGRYRDQLSLIFHLSEKIDSDTFLLIKEHPSTFIAKNRGDRGRWTGFYESFIALDNVKLVATDFNSKILIKNACSVATITGTVAIEAVHMKKPVISYGKHQITNHLPTVHYVSNFEETKVILNRLLSTQLDKIDLEKSRFSLYKAQIETSVDLPEYKDAHISVKLEDAMAEKALKLLYEEYIKE